MTKQQANLYVITTPEAAQMFGLTLAGVQLAVLRGHLPARKSVSAWLINLTDAIDRWGRPKNCPPELEQAVEEILKERGG